MVWQEIAAKIAETTGTPFRISDRKSIGGGCINQAYKLQGQKTNYFVKLNQAVKVEMFQAEALGLKQMYDTQTITIPQPICWGVASSNSYIVLEWLDLGRANNSSWLEMGKQLALMHHKGTAAKFGWDTNNTIGSTPQINSWIDNWADFFAEQRIGYQLHLANRNGGNFNNPDEIVSIIKQKLANRKPQVSLVHGDLWSGNADITAEGQPTIFDPATYYGDREVDLAMTELFGGFPATFYQGYNQQWPLDPGYTQRKDIYNLYHILNHFNLFGGGYGSQAKRIIQQIS